MARLSFTIATLLAFMAAAHAADMAAPVYKASPPPPVRNWTGFYAGAGVGYGFSDTKTSLIGKPSLAIPTMLLPPNNNAAQGWLGMVNAGYDYQFNVGGWNL